MPEFVFPFSVYKEDGLRMPLFVLFSSLSSYLVPSCYVLMLIILPGFLFISDYLFIPWLPSSIYCS